MPYFKCPMKLNFQTSPSQRMKKTINPNRIPLDTFFVTLEIYVGESMGILWFGKNFAHKKCHLEVLVLMQILCFDEHNHVKNYIKFELFFRQSNFSTRTEPSVIICSRHPSGSWLFQLQIALTPNKRWGQSYQFQEFREVRFFCIRNFDFFCLIGLFWIF